jgi:protein TonB
MFDVLVESNRKGRRDVKGYATGILMSTVFQTAVIAAAVYATMEVATQNDRVDMDTIVLTLDEPEPEEQKPDEPPPPVITSLNPPPKGFQVLMAPVDIPKEIPPIDLSQRFDPRDYSGVGVEGGVFSGVAGGTGPVDLAQVFSEAVVDEPPERLSCPVPAYPRMMQQANIEGQVLLQFVVEPDGHVTRSTIEVLNSTHKAFEGPARDMVQRCLFRPGRIRAQAVRVLAQMPVVFALRSN